MKDISLDKETLITIYNLLKDKHPSAANIVADKIINTTTQEQIMGYIVNLSYANESRTEIVTKTANQYDMSIPDAAELVEAILDV